MNITEEQVREILEPIDELTISHILDDEVSVHNKHQQYWITSKSVTFGDTNLTIKEYDRRGGSYCHVFTPIAKLLKPIKTDLPDPQQRIKELETDLKVARGWQSKYLDTKTEHDKLKTNYQRLYEDYNKAIQRVKSLEGQLQAAVSQYDHEDAINKKDEELKSLRASLQRTEDRMNMYIGWFEDSHRANIKLREQAILEQA